MRRIAFVSAGIAFVSAGIAFVSADTNSGMLRQDPVF